MRAPQVEHGRELVLGRAAVGQHLPHGLPEPRNRPRDLVLVAGERNVEADDAAVLADRDGIGARQIAGGVGRSESPSGPR